MDLSPQPGTIADSQQALSQYLLSGPMEFSWPPELNACLRIDEQLASCRRGSCQAEVYGLLG